MRKASAPVQRPLADVARGVMAARTQTGDGGDSADAWLVAGGRGPLAGATYAGWQVGGFASDADIQACGGLGTIYRCRHLASAQPGLLEVLTGRSAADPEVVRRLLDQARQALPLVSPAVLRVLHAGTWAGVPFTLREHDGGTDLGRILQRLRETGERLDLAEVLALTSQIAHALADAEAVGLAHGDLQPRWVRVSLHGVVRVAGFGRALRLDPDGTYRAPEIADAPGDQRSDQYALGCLLYTLCCGRPPFSARTSPVLRRRHRFREPSWAARLNPQLGPEQLAVILVCLQKRPQDRYATMSDLARDLDALQAGTLTAAVSRGLDSTGAWAAYRAHVGTLAARWAPVAAIVLILLAAGMAGFQRWQGDEKPAATSPAATAPAGEPVSQARDGVAPGNAAP